MHIWDAIVLSVKYVKVFTWRGRAKNGGVRRAAGK